jgi:Zn finger protein HypA/HybF involved in hydrogenase expression
MPESRSRSPGERPTVENAPYVIECVDCGFKRGVDHYRRNHYTFRCPECGDEMEISEESRWDIKQDAKP